MNRDPAAQDVSELSSRLAQVESALSDSSSLDSGIAFQEIFLNLWSGKWFILVATLLSGALAVVVALRLPNEYTATVVLMPASASSASSLSRLAGQFGGIASLAGVSLGGQDANDKTTVATELIKSWGFQEQFIRSNNLEVAVIAAKGWNRKDNQLVIDPRVYDTRQRKWIGGFTSVQGQATEPSGWDLYKRFSSRLSISQDKKTGFTTLSVRFYSPSLAKEWVDKLVIAVNKYLQDQDQIEAEKSLQYLEDKMSQANLLEMRAVLSRLIEEQTKNLMLARVSDEYALKTLSPAKVPEEKSAPKRGAICIGWTLAGCFLSAMCWLIVATIRNRSKRA